MLDTIAERLAGWKYEMYKCIAGLLWILCLAALSSTKQALLDAAGYIRSIVDALGPLAVPGSVVAIGAVVGAVVVPYCTALVFEPVGLALANLSVRIWKKVRKWREKPIAATVALPATHILRAEIGCPEKPARDDLEMYLYVANPRIAQLLRRRANSISAEANMLPPAAILLGWATSELLLPPWAPVRPLMVSSSR